VKTTVENREVLREDNNSHSQTPNN